MDYSDALQQAIAEIPPRWYFSTWDYRTALDCSEKETEAVYHQYVVEQRRRACETVRELQDQRDAGEASRAQVESRAERKGAQAKERDAPPSSQTHLVQQSSSENAARSLEHLFDIACLNEQSRNNDGHEGSSDEILSDYPTVYCGIL